MAYKNLFFDLDDTVWAFSRNARETYEEVYFLHGYDRFFESFSYFYALYEHRNRQLWKAYEQDRITKEELNRQRFLYPLQQAGVDNPELASRFSADFFERIPYKKELMPHALEVLDYLFPRYRLYILSNGFRELQMRKLRSAGVDRYFRKVILSEDLGVMKPRKEIFHFALSATQSRLEESLMIGDNFDTDIAGARGAGMAQVFYNWGGRAGLGFRPTYVIRDLRELKDLL